MNKQEFIDKLRLALSGRVSASLVEENVAYYEEYINTQMRMGTSESAVLSSLGDPRLLAKTIISANNIEDTSKAQEDASGEYFGAGNRYYAQQRQNNPPKVVRVPGWVWVLLVVLILVVIISVVFSIVSALLPFVLPVLVIVFFIKLFRDWLN